MAHNKTWMTAKMGWLPIVICIVAVGIIFTFSLMLFNNQKTVVAISKSPTKKGLNTEGVTYIINRDTIVASGQCHLRILEAIVKNNTVLLYFSLENRFKGNISDVQPYLLDLENGNKPILNTNIQQFVGTQIEPNQIGSLVGEFDYSVGKSRHFKLGFRYVAKGLTSGGEIILPFDL